MLLYFAEGFPFFRFSRDAMREGTIRKLYYAIGEVSKMTGLEPHVLRYWETEFDQLNPRKNRGGRRVYTEEDVLLVRRLQRLLKQNGYTIQGARKVLAMEDEGDATESGVRRDLLELRAFLQDLLLRLE